MRVVKPRFASVALALLVLLTTLAACTSGAATTTTTSSPTPTTSPPPTTITTPPPTTQPSAAPPPEVVQYAKDWPLANKDYANTRATTDSTINSSNVATLGVAWATPFTGAGIFGSASTTPIIMGQTVYFQDLSNNVMAVDLATGAVKWKKTYGEQNIGPNGVAVGWGKVFGTASPYDFTALDAATGNETWRAHISDIPTVGTDIQPSLYGNLVYTSTVPGSSAGDFYSGGSAGVIYALDQATGKVVWTWNTVDSADIWGNKDVNSGGGAWYPPAIDTKTGTMFWGIGNPAPWPGTKEFPNGSSRPGPNLYTDSMVALNSQTGALKWFTQVNPHDNLDLDFQESPILATANINGKQQDIVIGSGKLGRVYAFNRETGAILWCAVVGTHQNDQLASIPSENVTRVYPGVLGGVETPMAYSDGVVYVPVLNSYAEFTPAAYTSGQPLNQSTGELLAIDVNTGKIMWQKTYNSVNVGGATVVNDVVITSTFDGNIYAYKKDTGAQLWNYKAPGPINAWPSIVGDMMVVPVGLSNPPLLLAFKLGATAPVVAMTPLNGSTMDAGNIRVNALALNFSLTDKLGQPNAAGQGHLHYFLDVDAPITPGQPAVTAPGTYVATANTTYTWPNVQPGTHTFSVELVNNDHTPLVPPVVAKATVTVVPPSPKVSILLPQNRSTVPPGNVTVTVQVSNFNIVSKLGQANASGEGHIHYFMDVIPPTTPGKPAVTAAGTYAAVTDLSYTWQNVKAGTHTFSVELVNNDHTPLATPVWVTVVVVVTTSGGGGP